MPTFYNVHIHVFTARAVPPRLQPWPLVPLARSALTGPALGWLLNNLGPSDSDALDRLAAFATIGRMKDARAVFEHVREFYSDEFRFVLLPVDLTYMGAGRPPQSYEQQLEELRVVKEAHPDLVHPFVAADPRRPGLLELVRRYIEDHDFAGVKLYPPLGFWPFDARLDPVYQYCVDHDLPVLTHCSRGGIYYRGDVGPFRVHPKTGHAVPGSRASDITDGLADPGNYRWVLESFPELRLCLAHYGGSAEWHRYLTQPLPVRDRDSWIRTVTDLLRNPDTPNVYADVAYTAAFPEYHPLIKVLADDAGLRHRILFGSDFYMVQRNITERQFGLALRAFVGEETWGRIASENPERWLGRGLDRLSRARPEHADATDRAHRSVPAGGAE